MLLKEAGWPALAVSLSASNQEGGVPLPYRFVRDDLATVFARTAILDEAMPPRWERRAQALYLENFFQKEKVRELYLALEQEARNDASLKYAPYGVARQFNDGDKAIGYLRQAVELDRVYAYQYLVLAEQAAEKTAQFR